MIYFVMVDAKKIHWPKIEKEVKGRLLMKLKGYQELEAILKKEGV